MKTIIATSVLLLLAGCATSAKSPALASLDGITYERDTYGNEIISSVKFEYSAPPPELANALPACLARVIDNRSVTLSDSSGSFFGAYSGHYYTQNNTRETGGGAVLSHVSDDSKSAIAQGTVKYTTTMALLPIERSVRFVVAANINNESRSFSFEKLEQAQLTTGAVANNGYSSLGAWSGADPDLAIASLRKIADSLNNCLSTQ